jgi:hypothetical protein
MAGEAQASYQEPSSRDKVAINFIAKSEQPEVGVVRASASAESRSNHGPRA